MTDDEGGLLVGIEDVVGPVHDRQIVFACDQHVPGLARIHLLQVDGDIRLLQLLLQQDRDLFVDLVAGIDEIVQRQPADAGGGQQALCLFRIIGPLQIVGIMVERTLRNEGIGDLALSEGDGVDDRLLVDRVVDRLADFLFRKIAVLMIDEQVISRVEVSKWTVRLASFFSSSTREKGTKIAASSWPACTLSMRVLSSGTEIHSTPSSETRSACQKFGFFSRITRSPRRHSLTTNAPEAIGFSA